MSPYKFGWLQGYGNVLEGNMRGFQVDGKTDKAVALMKTTRVYPLAKSANAPAMTFVNGSHQEIDTLFSDSGQNGGSHTKPQACCFSRQIAPRKNRNHARRQ